MAEYVWLEDIERLEAERNDGKSLDGYEILSSKKLTLLETLTMDIEHWGPNGIEFIGPSRIDTLKKGDKVITRYYGGIDFLDIDKKAHRRLHRMLDVLMPD